MFNESNYNNAVQPPYSVATFICRIAAPFFFSEHERVLSI